MARFLPILSILSLLAFASCVDGDTPEPAIIIPDTYNFERGGAPTVAFPGQTQRIAMAEELIDGLLDPDLSEATLLGRFRDSNNEGKNLRSKVAASRDFFFANATDAQAIRTDFEDWITAQVEEVFPAFEQVAAAGRAGQIADGGAVRYVSAKGVEYNQLVTKGLIGALMLDQAINNYLSPSVLDEAGNREDNTLGLTADGKPYTTMEHKWDEAYGYVFGTSPTPADPLATLGADDSFLNKYLGRLAATPEYSAIGEEVFEAFRTGRAAIVAADYALRDAEAEKLRRLLSRVVTVRAVYYLEQAANRLGATPVPYGSVFHDLSEGLGFIYSLQFVRDENGAPLYDYAAVTDIFNRLLGSENGLWDVEAETLRAIAAEIENQMNQ